MKPSSKAFHIHKQIFTFLSTSRLAVPLFLSAFIGTLTGLIIVGFIKCIAFTNYFFFHRAADFGRHYLGTFTVILIPVLGALMVNTITTFCPDVRGQGIPQVLTSLLLKRGKMSPSVILAKPLASAISIGSGASVGREGPAVQIGAGIGSLIGQILKWGEVRIRTLISCGIAAGISAVFNAPIAGVMFALETIVKDFGAPGLSVIVVASVAASIVSRIFLGESPAFRIPYFTLKSSEEILVYALLGFISALVSSGFIFTFDHIENIFSKWKVSTWHKAIMGSLVIGIIGFFIPQIFGMGFETIEHTFEGSFEIKFLLLLILFKILATSVSVASGSSGGTFAPALFVGAVLGQLFAKIILPFVSFPVSPPGAYAIVGMASVFAGAFHAPVTAIFLVFELTQDYHIILPIMVASVIATIVCQLISHESLDMIKLHKTGLDVRALEDSKILNVLQVRDAMSKNFKIIPPEMRGKEIISIGGKENNTTLLVVDVKGELLGEIKQTNLENLLFENEPNLVIASDLVSSLPISSFPEESLSEAASLIMAQNLTSIPVFDPDGREILGVLKSEDIFKTYTKLASKKSELLDRIETHSQSKTLAYFEFTISRMSGLNEKCIKDIDIPKEVIITAIQRGRDITIPRGNTILKSKDKISVAFQPIHSQILRNWLKENKINN